MDNFSTSTGICDKS